MGQEDIGQDLDALREDVTKLRADLSQLAKALLEKGKSETDSAKDKVVDELMAGLRTARVRGNDTVESVEHRIQEKPLMSMLIAFFVGLLLGKLFDKG